MTPQERMQKALEASPNIGRIKLMKEANVTENVARLFLKKNKKLVETKSLDSKEARLTIENKHLRQQLNEQENQLIKLAAASDILKDLSSAQLSPPNWLLTSSGKIHKAIATVTLADPHFDEVVNASELGGVNAYNRQIAQLRLRRYFNNVVKLGRDIFTGIEIEGLVVAMLGDIVSGNIHEELAQSNAAAILDTCLFWSEEISAGIENLLKFYPQLFVPCVVGNHGRQTNKPRHKGRVKDNFDFLIYSLVARYFRNNSNISFLIPETSDANYNIYNTKYVITHGDQFKGGSGIAGALSPLLIGDARKRKRSNAINKPYDYMVMGHWHQEIDTMGIIASNSMKGYDEYAMNSNFAYSEPSQSFWLTDPDKGRTIRAPVHVRDAKEDWNFEDRSSPVWLNNVAS